jgi:hypothetical protein
MDHNDLYGFSIIIIIIIIVVFYWFRRWLYSPTQVKLPIPSSGRVPEGKAVDYMTEEGYMVIEGKHKMSIHIYMDEQEMHSSYYADYFVQQDESVYAVKLAKERMPISLTGSGIRDKLLPYYLLYEGITGVLYVDLEKRTIHKIRFEMEA